MFIENMEFSALRNIGVTAKDDDEKSDKKF